MSQPQEDQGVEILLVEDNRNDVKLTLHALKKHRLTNKIMVVRDGQEALDYLFCEGTYRERNGHHKPRLILLDLKLPKVSGLEVLQRIKSDERTRRLPVAVLTSSREDRDVDEVYALGVNSYIVKPVDFDQFADAVYKLGFYWMLLNESPAP